MHSGLKAAVQCINPGDIYRLAIRANITEEEFIAKYINDNDGFIKFLEEYRISTTLSVPQFFANKDLIMPPSEHFTQYSQFKIDEHISHFLEVIKTKASTLQQLGCTEKEIAVALVNSLQPEIFKTAVSQQHGKTIAAVLENIDAVMVTFEIHQTIQTMSYPQKHKQKSGAPLAETQNSTRVDSYKANSAIHDKFHNVKCANCKSTGHYASWCTELCQRCSPSCGSTASECSKAMAIAQAEKAAYDAKRRKTKKVIIINNNNNNFLIHVNLFLRFFLDRLSSLQGSLF